MVVQMEEPGQVSPEGVNVVLDMEKQGNYHSQFVREGTLYLPIYKRPWSKVKILQNLDISVPIGYNTVIVKGR